MESPFDVFKLPRGADARWVEAVSTWSSYMEFLDPTLGGLAPSVNSLCRWQEKRTMRKPEVQIRNFGSKKEAS